MGHHDASTLCVGITGTRHGSTPEQLTALTEGLRRLRTDGFGCLHHGDCVGVDSEAHDLARKLGMRVVIHPPISSGLRAYRGGNEHRYPAPYLARNRASVHDVDLVIAVPDSSIPSGVSGTWYTARYALMSDRPVFVIHPSGQVQEHQPAG